MPPSEANLAATVVVHRAKTTLKLQNQSHAASAQMNIINGTPQRDFAIVIWKKPLSLA